MDVDVDPRLVSSILAQLRTRNAAECAFHGITADYQALLRQCMELAVGVKQPCVLQSMHAMLLSQRFALSNTQPLTALGTILKSH